MYHFGRVYQLAHVHFPSPRGLWVLLVFGWQSQFLLVRRHADVKTRQETNESLPDGYTAGGFRRDVCVADLGRGEIQKINTFGPVPRIFVGKSGVDLALDALWRCPPLTYFHINWVHGLVDAVGRHPGSRQFGSI